LWLWCTPFPQQTCVQWGQILDDRLVFSPSFSCPHELASIWTYGRLSGLPMSLVITKYTHMGGVYTWLYKDLHILERTCLSKFWASSSPLCFTTLGPRPWILRAFATYWLVSRN
jgi:hypothetical protein